MRQLLYVSSATKPFSEEELEALVSHARRKNKLRGVTGMMLHAEGGFLQVLEGPPPAVETLLKIIRDDDRHTGLKILLDWDAPRTFPDWSMGFKLGRLRDATDLAFDLSRAIATSEQGPAVGVEVLALFRDLYTANERLSA